MIQTPATPAAQAPQPINGFACAPFAQIASALLLTAGDASANPSNYNTMTISWGGLGVVWGKPAATVYVRRARETFRLMEDNDLFTLAFLPAEWHDKLITIAGNQSGRDIDKAAAMGLTPVSFESGAVSFKEAAETLVCRKLYADDIDPCLFTDASIDAKMYRAQGEPDYHRVYIGEVIARCAN